ncbi:MAG: 16S rRNA (cytosine(1402)-N(4))-methyltransferase [Verrucomicrobia bacterium]|nr:MAG: 16S rRNA (cytosine(1402)-N(4))-methyltransferase [Verrucomicrobiota bacterium]PYL45795.1 MAG: 16S rRNA (cytosine(1402)-N(4))-methyltransferase [Verrucomicrobiota bacterium]
MAHSVSDHLHVMIADYDRFIRTVIPHYETMRAVQLELLARCLPSDGRVIDLGGGTGALARAVAEKFPAACVEIWDTDPAMLEVAQERCAAFGDRVHLIERSFAEPLSACDAVVACIALHHVKDMAEKGKIYANVFRALRPGGIFANADCVMSETSAVRAASYEGWAKFMEEQGLSPAETQQQFAEWANEDYYPPLATELRLLAEAGFAEPDCFWRTAPFTVFGGVRS